MVWAVVLLTFVLGAAPAGAAAWWFHHVLPQQVGQADPVFDFYVKSMRGSFFSGFLTIGGFLLSLKTFVIVKMKEGLFDTEEYRKKVVQARALGSKDGLYGPLQRLSSLLFSSILAALITSALQLTLGLVPTWWAVMVCVAGAGGTIVLLVVSLFHIKRNLDTWFEGLQSQPQNQQAQLPSGPVAPEP